MGGWVEYLAASAAFLGAHVIPAMPRIRGWLVTQLGRRAYLAGFSLLSVMLLAWLIRAAGQAPYVALWDAGNGGRWLINLAMPLAILSGCLARGLSGLVLAFAIWAGAHLLVNGDLAHAGLFGGMLAFALTGLARSGLPSQFRPTVPRLGLALLIWAGFLHLHPLVIGASPLPF